MVAYRKTLHESFLLPETGPVFRLGNQHFFFDDLRKLGKLISPHEAFVGESTCQQSSKAKLLKPWTIDRTIGIFGCPPTIVKSQPQLLKT
jgi:hypothetical protein